MQVNKIECSVVTEAMYMATYCKKYKLAIQPSTKR